MNKHANLRENWKKELETRKLYETDIKQWFVELAQTDRTDVGLTLTFKKQVTREKAQRALKAYLNKVNRILFKNAYKRYGKRMTCIAVCELGKSGVHAHYHLSIKKPKHINYWQFKELLLNEWIKLATTSLKHERNRYDLKYSSGWDKYCAKTLAEDFDFDALDTENTTINTNYN